MDDRDVRSRHHERRGHAVRVSQVEDRVGPELLQHLLDPLEQQRGLVRVGRRPAPLAQRAAHLEVVIRPSYTKLAVEDRVQLVIEVLAGVHELVFVAVFVLAAIEQLDQLEHANDVGTDAEQGDQSESFLRHRRHMSASMSPNEGTRSAPFRSLTVARRRSWTGPSSGVIVTFTSYFFAIAVTISYFVTAVEKMWNKPWS